VHSHTDRTGIETVALAEFAGVPAAMPPDPEALSRRTAELVSDLVEPAKAEALETLGEGERALDIATGWLRPKLVMTPAPVPGTRSPINSRLAVRRSSGL
jgi:hypothetical protein